MAHSLAPIKDSVVTGTTRFAPRVPRHRTRTEGDPKQLVVVVVVMVALAFAVLIPIALVLDRQVDRTRPMYDDIHRMEYLQYRVAQAGRTNESLTVGPGESVRIAGSRFTPSAGVTIEVKVTPDGYCVRGENSFGDSPDWVCADGSTNPS